MSMEKTRIKTLKCYTRVTFVSESKMNKIFRYTDTRHKILSNGPNNPINSRE